jgi:hypothetical protein
MTDRKDMIDASRTLAEERRKATGKNRMFEDIPSEHPWLRLDEKVRVIDERSIYFGLIGTVSNIRMGDRAYVAVEFDHVPADVVSRRVGESGRHSYMSYSPAVELVPTRDEHEQIIGNWVFTARIRRNRTTGVVEEIVVTGPMLRVGDAVFLATEFLKDTPADTLSGAITKAFMTLVAPKIIDRITEVEDGLTKLTEKKLAL